MDIIISKAQNDALIEFIDNVAALKLSKNKEWRHECMLIRRISCKSNRDLYFLQYDEIILEVNEYELRAIINFLNAELQQLVDIDKNAFKNHEVLFDLHEILINSYIKSRTFHSCSLPEKPFFEEKDDLPF